MIRDRWRRPIAGLVLAAALGLSWAACRKLELLERRPAQTVPYYAVFLATVALAWLAGVLAPREPQPVLEREAAPFPASRVRTRRWIAAALALGGLSLALAVQGRPQPPWIALAGWVEALGATVWFFSTGGTTRAVSLPMSAEAKGRLLAFLGVLAIAGAARMVGLSQMPASLGGDETNQVLDGRETIEGRPGADVFGTGWYGTMRLGMLPAGIGSVVFRDPIAGPRLPYGLVGTVSVAACAAAAGILAGPWAASACAALLVFCPYHVHFSRLASVMILDACAAGLLFLLLLRTARSGSRTAACLAGIAGGLTLYGYSGGRVLTAAFLLIVPFTVLSRPKRERAWTLAALCGGFLVCALPTLRVALTNPEWRLRFSTVSIFEPAHWKAELEKFGSPAAVLWDQFQAGTIDLLATHSGWEWFRGFPMLAPIFLAPLFLAGLGWTLGRRRFFATGLLALVAAGNFAALVLTESAPAPQRASSLVPAMAVLGGAAIGGFLSLLPERDRRGHRWQSLAGILLVGTILATTFQGLPDEWAPSSYYGGDGGALATSAFYLLRAPRYRGESIIFHSRPHIDADYPSFPYLLPQIRWVNLPDEEVESEPRSGLHLYFKPFLPAAHRWEERLGIRRDVILTSPDRPRDPVALLLRVPG